MSDNYCPADRPYPPSYDAVADTNPDECVAVDPCQPDGTTLWHMLPCDMTTTTTAAVPVDELPPTGSGDTIALAGLALLFAGTAALIVRWKNK
jgi:hypothetical protein